MAYLFEVVVLTRYAQALLRVGNTGKLGGLVAQKDVLKLVHPSVGKHQRRVVFYDHGSRRHNLVLLRAEEIKECFPNLIRIHTEPTLFQFYLISKSRNVLRFLQDTVSCSSYKISSRLLDVWCFKHGTLAADGLNTRL